MSAPAVRYHQPPAVDPCLTEDFVRCARGRTARGQPDTRIEEKPHVASRKRCISASSSEIHEAICSRENFRGVGSFTPDRRKRVARNRISSCFCSGVSASAAASISTNLLMGMDFTTSSNPCNPADEDARDSAVWSGLEELGEHQRCGHKPAQGIALGKRVEKCSQPQRGGTKPTPHDDARFPMRPRCRVIPPFQGLRFCGASNPGRCPGLACERAFGPGQ